MKLEELQEKLQNDLKIDLTKLQYEASNNPVLYGNWIKIYSDIKKNLLVYENSKKKALKARLDHYTGRGEEVCMDVYEKSEMKTVLSADSEVIKAETTYQYWLLLLDVATRALEAIKSRGFSIKHALECRQFEAGVK
ncbi:single stranded DNA-binding protein [Providencia phage PSTRCR_127]|nr:single stranded DNA-binding protein [Providencia phage PSTRCR_127]QQV89057.1 single stranded DNA-binding protein [Providencia phage PSTRCR_121]UGO50230.1 putative recombination, repair and ssDNA protein [Morganella phage vB_MmoM_Rgz1]